MWDSERWFLASQYSSKCVLDGCLQSLCQNSHISYKCNHLSGAQLNLATGCCTENTKLRSSVCHLERVTNKYAYQGSLFCDLSLLT